MRQLAAINLALLLLSTLSAPAQRKAAPTGLRFQGAPQYTQQELLAAAGVKPGVRLTAAELKARARQLSETGFFKEVKLSTESKGPLFTLVPANPLYPMHLDNVPLTPGNDLDAALRQRFPLFHGMLPASGSTVDGICTMFEGMLAAKGVKTTIKASLTSGLGAQKITAVNFTVTSPAVHIGHIQLSGVSPAMEPKASLTVSGQTGNNYDAENTKHGLQHAFEDLYQNEGYAAVKVEVSQVEPFVVTQQSIEIPFSVAIKEGAVYKVGTMDLPSGMPVTRADVDKTISKYPPKSGRPLDLFMLAVRDAYHARGYLDAAVAQHPSFNEATHVVNYSLEVTPGTQYKFASVSFEGAPEAMSAKLKAAWKMSSGDVFDESYLATFTAQAQKKDKQLSKWLQSEIVTYDVKPDPAAHQVNCVYHFAKAIETPR
jgi:outer membrane protein assembly factor BamA